MAEVEGVADTLPVALGDGEPVVLPVSDTVRELVGLAVIVSVGAAELVALTEDVAVDDHIEVSEAVPVRLPDSALVPVQLPAGVPVAVIL